MTTDQAASELEALMANAPDAAADPDNEEHILDLSEAKGDFEPLTGKYPVEVTKAEFALTKTNQEPSIDLTLRVFEGDNTGRVVFKKLMLQGAGSGITKRAVEALGYEVDWDAPKLAPRRFIGLKCYVTCAPDKRPEYKHKTEITGFAPYTVAEVQLPQ